MLKSTCLTECANHAKLRIPQNGFFFFRERHHWVDKPNGAFASAVTLCFRNRALLNVPDFRKSPVVELGPWTGCAGFGCFRADVHEGRSPGRASSEF